MEQTSQAPVLRRIAPRPADSAQPAFSSARTPSARGRPRPSTLQEAPAHWLEEPSGHCSDT
eukprot:11450322-Alexandrium_andersonii.AAC.1